MSALLAPEIEAVAALPRTPASDVKRLGWRGLMRNLQAQGTLLVTNHDAPEAVILSLKDYAAVVRLARQGEAGNASALQALRQRFDERLAVLQRPDAAARLRAVLATPPALNGQVKAGTGF